MIVLTIRMNDPEKIHLESPLLCKECDISYREIPVEDGDESAVHCRECGAFICHWGELTLLAAS